MTRTPRRHLAAATLALALGLGCAACTGDGSPPDTAPGSASPSEPVTLETTVTAGTIAGPLDAAAGQQAVAEVAAVVDGWLDAAYVEGDYPRSSFDDSFPGFSPGAARDARGDLRLMTNADIGPRIDGVVAKVRRLTVDLLAVRDAARAATARVRLVFDTEGGSARRVSVTGRLALVHEGGAWQVVAYDIAKGSR